MSENRLILKTVVEIEMHPIYRWLNSETRRYLVTRNLDGNYSQQVGEGTYGNVVMCRPLDDRGDEIPDAPDLVAKLANVKFSHNGREISRREREQRLDHIHSNNRHEYIHVRKRLAESNHANLILDYGRHSPAGDKEHEVPFTVQPFLADSRSLNRWLLDRNKNGDGIRNRRIWLEILLQIAFAVKDMHLRRVTHGDLQPGNIFVREAGDPVITLIDFGESQLFIPALRERPPRRLNPYAAPELLGPRASLTEKVDIFAFGQLAIYLAVGKAQQLNLHPGLGNHRGDVYNLLASMNKSLLLEEPRVLDLIGRATAIDPADRPRMIDLIEDLQSMYATISGTTYGPARKETAADMLRRLAGILDKEECRYPVLTSLLERQVRELGHTFEGLESATEMVQFSGTRDHSIRILVSLFDAMTPEDSWTAATTLDMWQYHALGLDGAYFSAGVRAAMRGASVRRAFIFSIDELGLPFATQLLERLKEIQHPCSAQLFDRLQSTIEAFKPNARFDLSDADRKWRAGRLYRLVKCLSENVIRWNPGSRLNVDPIVNDVISAGGLVIALCPVSSISEVVDRRDKNPVSLLFKGDQRQWFLVGTDAQGRRTSIIENDTAGPSGVLYPHLLGVRVFRSVQEGHVPGDRLSEMKTLFKNSVNIGGFAEHLCAILKSSAATVWGT